MLSRSPTIHVAGTTESLKLLRVQLNELSREENSEDTTELRKLVGTRLVFHETRLLPEGQVRFIDGSLFNYMFNSVKL